MRDAAGARYVVVGTSGSGKSTFARRLASLAQCDYVELDALHWDRDWTPRTHDAFERDVRARTAGDRWVVDGNYNVMRDIVWGRATDIVWLNFSRAVVFSRVIRRTFVRAARREELWAGNRETFRKALLSRDSILLWSFTTFGRNRRRYAAARTASEHPHLRWHEVRSPREARAFLQAVRAMSHNSAST